jgi:stearoyl-CoA desaturase (delta-9 desaturase)
LDENQNILENLETKIEKKEKTDSYKVEIVWRNVILFLDLHIFAVYGAYIIVKYAKWQNMVFAYVIALLG